MSAHIDTRTGGLVILGAIAYFLSAAIFGFDPVSWISYWLIYASVALCGLTLAALLLFLFAMLSIPHFRR